MLKIFKNFFLIFSFSIFIVSSSFSQNFSNDNENINTNVDFPLIPIEKFSSMRPLPPYKSKNLSYRKDVATAKTEFPLHLDLTEYLGVIGQERNQGNCGSCWVWSGIGILEAQFNKALKENVFSGVSYVKNQKFSINFLEAKLLKFPHLTYRTSSICDGGTSDIFQDLLTSDVEGYNYLVPKSNTNANATFSELPTETNFTRNLDLIQINPHVNINNLEVTSIIPDGDNNEEVIHNVIEALNDGHLVEMDYYVYRDFKTFWKNEDESLQYYFTNTPGSSSEGGHATIIVGYDISDSNPNNHYWIVQNSWGSTELRPKGQFRLNMQSGFGYRQIISFEVYNAEFEVENEICDNLDNDCNTVVDDDDSCQDYCPENEDKTLEGICGCDVNDIDSDNDGTPDCNDECPNTPELRAPSSCGGDVSDEDSDGTYDCVDSCPLDPNKPNPGICGCAVEDSPENLLDDDNNGIINCHEDKFFNYKKVKLNNLTRYYSPSSTSRELYSSPNLCVQTEINDLYCMGTNYGGQLGIGENENITKSTSLLKVKNLNNVTSFSVGDSHICATSNSKVYCWGADYIGELGTYHSEDQFDQYNATLLPTEIEFNIENPSFVTCGYRATCVTNTEGNSYCFGFNQSGKLGVDGPRVYLDEFDLELLQEGYICLPDGWNYACSENMGTFIFNGQMATVPLTNIVGMSMSPYETVTISNGKLYNYGLHFNYKKVAPEARYDKFKNLISLSNSETDTCAINEANELYCLDTYLHHTSLPREDYQVQKIPLENVTSVACASETVDKWYDVDYYKPFGYTCEISEFEESYDYSYPFYYPEDNESHICAISNEDLYCWGRGNGFAQLGSTKTTDFNVPTKVESAQNVTDVGVTAGTTCYISNGELYCFGDLFPFGIKRQSPNPCKIIKAQSKVADTIHAGDDCEYIGGAPGKYSYKRGNYICKPYDEQVEYEDTQDDIPNCIDDLGITPIYPEPVIEGNVNITMNDAIGNKVEGVEVYYNGTLHSLTSENGEVNITNIPENEEFIVTFKKDGHHFVPAQYQNKITKDKLIHNVDVIIYEDIPEEDDCEYVPFDFKELRQSSSKIRNFALILNNKNSILAKNYYLKIRELIKTIPFATYTCGEQDGHVGVSYERTKSRIKKLIKNLYKQALLNQKLYKKANKKSNKWLRNRNTRLDSFYNDANSKIDHVPDVIYVRR